MRSSIAAMRTILSLFLLLAACDHALEHSGPAGIPYACADGRALRIFYDSGDPNRSPARLVLDGQDIVLNPAPAMTGLRYVAEGGIAWTAEGDSAILSEPWAGGPRRTACTRLRSGVAEAAEQGAHH
jgi:membrane-bound inhibitor of C-type lysozyme